MLSGVVIVEEVEQVAAQLDGALGEQHRNVVQVRSPNEVDQCVEHLQAEWHVTLVHHFDQTTKHDAHPGQEVLALALLSLHVPLLSQEVLHLFVVAFHKQLHQSQVLSQPSLFFVLFYLLFSCG